MGMTVVVALIGAALLSLGQCLDPEVHMDAIQLITSKGYPAERHYVTTHDGYILQMHRIPYSPKHKTNGTLPVFFLQHGLLCSSTNWLTNLANESFAFILSDAGFDVWMGNIRGNTYSRNHTHLTPKDRAFWNFSFDEHSLIDLPAMLDKVMDVTKQDKMFYAGHSQGTVMGFAGFTANKTLASHIKAFFALAPIAMVQHVKGLFAILSDFYKPLEFILDLFGTGEFFPNDAFIDWLADKVCPFDRTLEDDCRDILFLICGFDVQNINVTRIPVYYSHTPAGSSVKNVVHYAQEVKSGKFRKYDYGKDGNMDAYGMPSPPAYNMSLLQVPTAVFSGGQDWLADPRDVEGLISQLDPTIVLYTKIIPQYNHLDFIWGLDAALEVYQKTVTLAKQFK